MRKLFIQEARLLHGFFILSIIFCLLNEQITGEAEKAFSFSLFFLPVLLICSIGSRRAPGVIHYFLLCAVLIFSLYFLSGLISIDSINRIILIVFSVLIIIFYFMARASKKTCWLEIPGYWTLVMYLVVCIIASYNRSEFLIKVVTFVAGCDFLIIHISINSEQMGAFIDNYSNMERLPVQRMRENNSRMLWIQSVFTAGVMIASPYLKIDELILNIGRALRILLAWILSFLKNEEPEEIVELVAERGTADFGPMPMEEEPSLLMQIIDKILQIIGYIGIIAFAIFLLTLLVRKILQLYRQFNEHVEENGDIVENLRTGKKKEDKVRLNQEKNEKLFLNFSPDARIRKHYKKRIQREKKEEIKESWTPEQIENMIIMSEDKKVKFHAYYEKARYAKESCTKEEMQEMLDC